jgi:hypothetical protein
VVKTLDGVGTAVDADTSRLDKARTAATQASAAASIERDYATGARRLAALPAVTRHASQTRSIDATVNDLASLYGSLAAAARARNGTRYEHESDRIAVAEGTLRRQVRLLT